MYDIDEKLCNKISKYLFQVNKFEFDLLGNNCICTRKVDDLKDIELYGVNLEYNLKINEKYHQIYFSIGQGENSYYYIFVSKVGKTLIVLNLNINNQNQDDRIIFDIQIIITSPQSATKEERAFIRDECVKKLREYGMNVDKKNRIYLGQYDIPNEKFIDTTPKDLLTNLLVIGICKNEAIFGI